MHRQALKQELEAFQQIELFKSQINKNVFNIDFQEAIKVNANLVKISNIIQSCETNISKYIFFLNR